jgi:hypothetical protein
MTTARKLAPEPYAEIVNVTPARAQEWLGHNLRNRPLKRQKIDQYTRDMAAGRWQLTGEALKFAPDGQLLDGQNRLHAVVASGATIRSWVMWNVPATAQDVMDSGAARSASDALAMQGIRNAKRVTAAARIAMAREAGTSITGSRFTHSEVQDWVMNNLELTDVPDLLGSRGRNLPVTPGVSLYCYWQLMLVDAEACDQFFEGFAEGVGLETGSPIIALRKRLTGSYGATRKITPEEQISCVFRAWNFWRKGQRVQKIQLPSETRYGLGANIPEPE